MSRIEKAHAKTLRSSLAKQLKKPSEISLGDSTAWMDDEITLATGQGTGPGTGPGAGGTTYAPRDAGTLASPLTGRMLNARNGVPIKLKGRSLHDMSHRRQLLRASAQSQTTSAKAYGVPSEIDTLYRSPSSDFSEAVKGQGQHDYIQVLGSTKPFAYLDSDNHAQSVFVASSSLQRHTPFPSSPSWKQRPLIHANARLR